MSDHFMPYIIIDLDKKIIRIHHSVFEKIGNPTYIQFLINRKKGALAVKRCTKSTDQAIKIPKPSGDYYDIYGKYIGWLFQDVCSKWSINDPYIIYGNANSDNTYICFWLKQAQVYNRFEVFTSNERSAALIEN